MEGAGCRLMPGPGGIALRATASGQGGFIRRPAALERSQIGPSPPSAGTGQGNDSPPQMVG